MALTFSYRCRSSATQGARTAARRRWGIEVDRLGSPWIGIAKAGKSAAAEIVKEVAAQESKHATAKAWRLRDYGDHPWCRAKQAALYDDSGDQWVPLDQRLLCLFRHVPGYDLRGRCEHFRHCTANVRVAQNVPLRHTAHVRRTQPKDHAADAGLADRVRAKGTRHKAPHSYRSRSLQGSRYRA